MKAKVTALLIKYGMNPDFAAKIVEQNFDDAVKAYPDAKASFIAKVVTY